MYEDAVSLLIICPLVATISMCRIFSTDVSTFLLDEHQYGCLADVSASFQLLRPTLPHGPPELASGCETFNREAELSSCRRSWLELKLQLCVLCSSYGIYHIKLLFRMCIHIPRCRVQFRLRGFAKRTKQMFRISEKDHTSSRALPYLVHGVY
jgi:hypothetical protein